jgi:PAS domain S-box-containing protein
MKIMLVNKKNINFPVVPISTVLVIFFTIFGYFFYKITVNYGTKNEQQNLLFRAITAASSFNPATVASLEGNPKEVEQPYFKDISSQLIRIKNANKDARFVYLMARKSDKIIFLADAEPPTSEDYSTPGDIYEDASSDLFEIFLNGKPFVEGPIKDQWGLWVSGHAPIRDPESNKVVAIIGIDIAAQIWQNNIKVYKWFCLLITGLIFLIVLISFLALYRISSVNKNLIAEITERKRIGRELRESEKKHRNFLENLNSGVVAHAPDTTTIYCNQRALQILGLSMEQMIGKKAFDPNWKFINEDGTDMLLEDFPINLALKSKTEVKDYVVGVVRPDRNYVTWVVCNSFSVINDDELEHVLISFIDITERKHIEEEKEKLIKKLKKALDEIKTLRGILPVCCVCGLIRDDTGVEQGQGEWMKADKFITEKTDAQLSHSYCPNCYEKAMEEEL